MSKIGDGFGEDLPPLPMDDDQTGLTAGSPTQRPGGPRAASVADTTHRSSDGVRSGPPQHPAIPQGIYGYPGRAPSVRGEDIVSGSGNVTEGEVVRRKKRTIKGVIRSGAGENVSRNYRVAAGVQFNNYAEVAQDSVSADFAQEILEAVMKLWKVPFDQPKATKYCEDLVFMFIVAVSASDKADWGYEYDVPIAPGSGQGNDLDDDLVVANFQVFSDYLARDAGVTRRQFARGVSNRIWQFLKDESNVHVLDDVAAKVGCDKQMAPLAFDGSTHCQGLNPRQIQFTKTLENRNLFERDDEAARGSSDRLMGVVSAPRAVR